VRRTSSGWSGSGHPFLKGDYIEKYKSDSKAEFIPLIVLFYDL